MLKNISSILSPELLYVLAQMGHGDEIVFGDANFPAESMNDLVIRADGHGIPELLEAVLTLFPLDQYSEKPAGLMQKVPGDPVETPVWETYRTIIEKEERDFGGFEMIERFAFYERAAKAYAVVATGERSLYGNLSLIKGVIP
jgi:L-fucose mutarotase